MTLRFTHSFVCPNFTQFHPNFQHPTMVKFLRKLNLWLIFFTLLTYLTPFISPQTMSFTAILGLAYPWLVVLNVLFIFLWAVSRYRFWWYSCVVILLGINHLRAIFGFNFFNKSDPLSITEQKAQPISELKIMSYNISSAEARGSKVSRLNDFIEKENCDIICVQELTNDEGFFKTQMQRLPALGAFPYRLRSSLTTVAIFSRFPVVTQQNLKLEPVNGGNGCEWADIKINDKTIRFYNVHLQSNSVSGLADELAENGSFDEKSTWAKMARMIKRFRSNTLIRAKQVEIIAAHVKKSPHRVILCGDLNDIPISYTYATLCEDLQDGFKKAGSGFSTTYAGNVPALKIDYILADKALIFEDFDIENVPFSDHFPVVARVKIR